MTEEKKSEKKTRTIWGVSVPVIVMGWVSFFTDISSEMIQSILPLFIFSIGGTALILGIIDGATTAIANIMKGVTGVESDKINKRKPFIVAGYTISNLSKPFIGLSVNWGSVLALKSVDRFGKGIRTSSRDVLISYYAKEHGKGFGIHRAMDTGGAVVGSLLAFIFLYFAWTYSQIIFFAIFPGIVAIALILTVKDVDPYKLEEAGGLKEKGPKVDKVDRKFVQLIIILGVIEFASLDIAFLILRSADYVGPELIYLIPLFYLVSNIVYMICSPITGTISDKIGRKPMIVVGLSTLFVSCIILAFPIAVSMTSIVLILVIFIMFGFYMASVDPISRAYIADLAGKNKRGRAYGYYYLSVGLISLGEGIVFGLFYDIFTYTGAFIYDSILLFICMIIFAITDFSKITGKDAPQTT